MKCAYCSHTTESKTGPCPRCGGQLAEAENETPRYERHEPFSYNGYIVWPLRDLCAGTREFHFYLGDRVVEIIAFSEDLWQDGIRPRMLEGESAMSFVWELFEVAQGQQEVMRIRDMNSRRPAHFEIRRVEDKPEPQFYSSTLGWKALTDRPAPSQEFRLLKSRTNSLTLDVSDGLVLA